MNASKPLDFGIKRAVTPLLDPDFSSDPGASPPKVDLVVPVCGQSSMTRRFLETLRDYTDYPYRLILVDNGSDDLPDSLVEGFKDPLLIRCTENLGFAAGCNMGIRAGNHPIAAVLNNDLILTRGWLRRVARALLSSPSIAAAAPCSNYAAGEQEVDLGPIPDRRTLQSKAEAFATRYPGQVEDVSFVTGMCLLVKRQVFNRIGLFDERFGPGNFEDNDLCLRLKNVGMRIVLARDTFIYHLGNRTFQALGMDYQALLRENRDRFYSKWAENPYIRGCRLEDQGDLPGAMECYLNALKEGTLSPEPLFRLGLILIKLDRFESAERAFRQYLDKCPESTRAQIGLAFAQGMSTKAEEGTARLRGILRERYLKEKDRDQLENLVHEWTASPVGQSAWC